jgi:hypothetical protein
LFYKNARQLLAGERVHDLRLLSDQFTGQHLSQTSLEPAVFRRYQELKEALPAGPFSPPLILGERGRFVDGQLVNFDVVAYLERLALLHTTGLSTARRILEIGAGYGGLAWFIRQVNPLCEYVVLDLPESLVYSTIYLALACRDVRHSYGVLEEGAGFSYLPNYRFPELQKHGRRFDLVINTLSMSEMTLEQVSSYCEGIRELIGDDGVFFEQNQDNRHLGMLFARERIKDYFPHTLALGGPGEAVSLHQGFANLWSNRPLDPVLARKVQNVLEMPRLVESREGFNYVAFRGNIYEVPQSVGPVDFLTDLARLPQVRAVR